MADQAGSYRSPSTQMPHYVTVAWCEDGTAYIRGLDGQLRRLDEVEARLSHPDPAARKAAALALRKRGLWTDDLRDTLLRIEREFAGRMTRSDHGGPPQA